MKKLIVNGKAWGEYEQAWTGSDRIEVEGYRTYGGVHTVRPVKNEDSQDDPDYKHLVRIYEKSGRKFELAIRRYVVQKDITSNVLNRFLNYIDFEVSD